MCDVFTLTYKDILKRMLARVSDKLDKREGSVIFDALAPVAYENAQMYTDLNSVIDNAFADTADRDHLIRRASEVGITPHPATAAVWSAKLLPATFSFDAGTRFNCGTMNLAITSVVGDGVYELTCEDAGTIGNTLSEDLLPIKYVSNLQSASLVALISEGADVETTEHLRARLLEFLQKPSTSGNKQDYYNWAMSIDGVGAAKVFPLADGAGTVKVVIADSNIGVATDKLILAVSSYIDSVRPIGATVSVVSVTALAVNITAGITISTGYKLDDIQAAFKTKMTDYLNEIAFQSGEVKLTRVGSILLGISGVSDYTDLKLNGSAANITLTDTQVAQIGTITLEAQNG